MLKPMTHLFLSCKFQGTTEVVVEVKDGVTGQIYALVWEFRHKHVKRKKDDSVDGTSVHTNDDKEVE